MREHKSVKGRAMRIRYIKPGICCNEEIATLGPYAYILFTGLWMIADREGRFEWRPRRIKALAMPLWDDINSQGVENLLDGLLKSGFVQRYEVDGVVYGLVTHWKRHQRPDKRETQSQLPPPPGKAHETRRAKSKERVSITESETLDSKSDVLASRCNYAELQRQDSVTPMSSHGNSDWGMGNGEWETGGGRLSTTSSVEAPPKKPPLAEKTNAKQKTAVANTNANTAVAGAGAEPPTPDIPGETEPELKPAPVDDPQHFWYLRQSLHALAQQVHLPPPDDALVKKVFAAAPGVGALQIHEFLRQLWVQGKFENMRSWGFIPMLVSVAMKGAA